MRPQRAKVAENILILGGAGFIGSRLALCLRERGHRVRVLDTLAQQIHGKDPQASPLFRSIQGKVEFIHGSVTRREDLVEALRGIDVVVHLAAEHGLAGPVQQRLMRAFWSKARTSN